MEKIDLHGIRHEDVVRRLDSFFWEVMQKNINNIEVITGLSDKMKEIVKEACLDYDFVVNEHPTNMGCLIIQLV